MSTDPIPSPYVGGNQLPGVTPVQPFTPPAAQPAAAPGGSPLARPAVSSSAVATRYDAAGAAGGASVSPGSPAATDLGSVLAGRAAQLSPGIQAAEATAPRPGRAAGVLFRRDLQAGTVPGPGAAEGAAGSPGAYVSPGLRRAEAGGAAATEAASGSGAIAAFATIAALGGAVGAAAAGQGIDAIARRAELDAQYAQEVAAEAGDVSRSMQEHTRTIETVPQHGLAAYTPWLPTGGGDDYDPTATVMGVSGAAIDQPHQQHAGLADPQVVDVPPGGEDVLIDVDGFVTRASVVRTVPINELTRSTDAQLRGGTVAGAGAGPGSATLGGAASGHAHGPWLAAIDPAAGEVLEVRVEGQVDLARLDLRSAAPWYATQRDARALIRAALGDATHAGDLAAEKLAITRHEPGAHFWIGRYSVPHGGAVPGETRILRWQRRPTPPAS